MNQPMLWLLPVVSVYAAWRAVSFFRKGRPAIGIAVVFMCLLMAYEFVMQLIRIYGGPGGTGGAG